MSQVLAVGIDASRQEWVGLGRKRREGVNTEELEY